jgi:hypothetical protein
MRQPQSKFRDPPGEKSQGAEADPTVRQPCVRCGATATYFRAAAETWREFAIVRRANGVVLPLIPGREVPLCLECAAPFDPRCVRPWDAPPWVVRISGLQVRGGSGPSLYDEASGGPPMNLRSASTTR